MFCQAQFDYKNHTTSLISLVFNVAKQKTI